jgi:membrane-associated HD superfamily phosphohydrolase
VALNGLFSSRIKPLSLAKLYHKGVDKLSLSRYRNIDLLIFTVIAVVLDIVIGLQGFFRILLYVAISIPLILLCYVRWGRYGLLLNMVIVIVHLFVYAESFWINFGHSLALLSLSIALLFLKWKPMQRRKIPVWAIAVYFIGCYLFMSLVEWTIWHFSPVPMSMVNYLANYGFNMALGLGLSLIISLQKDLYVPMNLYLRELAEEKEKNKGN